MDDDNVRRTLLALLQEIENPGWNSKLYAETLLTLLVSQLIRCASNLTGSQPTPYRKGGLASWRLKRTLELLEGDLGAAPTLGELARHLGLPVDQTLAVLAKYLPEIVDKASPNGTLKPAA